MEETAENKPPFQVTIDASITTSQVSNCDPSINPTKTKTLVKTTLLGRIHAGYFRISISFGAQSLLWKVLTLHRTDSKATHLLFHKFPSTTFLLLYCLALLASTLLSLLYILKCFLHFRLVKAEFSHHIGLNYSYAPWISWLLLLQSAPLIVPNSVQYDVLWWVFTVPIFILDLKIYGQWFTTEKRFLSMVANPTSQISVIGNLVGAQTAAQMGWKESAVFMFSLGMAHYLILFVTLYQRLIGRKQFPATLQPTFLLFPATPSLASLAWSSISGTFDTQSKMLFFLSLFMFISLVSRPALFKKSLRRFNVAWWAYSFPITFIALASVEYAHKANCRIASLLMLALSVFSVLVFLCLMMLTAANTDKLFGKGDPTQKFDDDLKAVK